MTQGTLTIGGHRGSGQTDAPRIAESEQAKLAENTLDSIEAAIADGASLIELDVMLSADGVPMVTHSNELQQHVLVKAERDKLDSMRPFVSQYSAQELAKFGVGPRGDGAISTLQTVLVSLEKYPDVTLNIELKGRQGTEDDSPHFTNTLVEQVVNVLKESSVAESQILFSSFAASQLHEALQKAPTIRRAMLFTHSSDRSAGMDVFAKTPADDSLYEILTPESLKRLHEALQLSAIHPEISTVREYHLQLIREDELKGPDGTLLGVNTWSSGEQVTEAGDEWRAEPLPHLQERLPRLALLAQKYSDIPMGVITNHVPEMVQQRKVMAQSMVIVSEFSGPIRPHH